MLIKYCKKKVRTELTIFQQFRNDNMLCGNKITFLTSRTETILLYGNHEARFREPRDDVWHGAVRAPREQGHRLLLLYRQGSGHHARLPAHAQTEDEAQQGNKESLSSIRQIYRRSFI